MGLTIQIKALEKSATMGIPLRKAELNKLTLPLRFEVTQESATETSLSEWSSSVSKRGADCTWTSLRGSRSSATPRHQV